MITLNKINRQMAKLTEQRNKFLLARRAQLQNEIEEINALCGNGKVPKRSARVIKSGPRAKRGAIKDAVTAFLKEHKTPVHVSEIAKAILAQNVDAGRKLMDKEVSNCIYGLASRGEHTGVIPGEEKATFTYKQPVAA